MASQRNGQSRLEYKRIDRSAGQDGKRVRCGSAVRGKLIVRRGATYIERRGIISRSWIVSGIEDMASWVGVIASCRNYFVLRLTTDRLILIDTGMGTKTSMR